MKYCCESMQISVERGEIEYKPIRGSFWFYIRDEAWGGAGTFHQKHCCYCPYCGTKLPIDRRAIMKNGSDIYTDEIEKAVGKEWCDITEDEIPEEFKTDEWWKKRRL